MRGSRVILRASIISMLGMTLLRCGMEGQEAQDRQAVRILAPSAGQDFKVDDSLKIIIESDFSRFGGGVSVDYSPDSSRNWYLIQSFSRRTGKIQDTLSWFAKETGDVSAGSALLLRAYDYDRDFVVETGYFTFSE